MVWLTGGMFAIACSMIASLLVFILFQGLATHWQRPIALFPLNENGFVAGELQNVQPYTISRQSIDELGPVSKSKAEALLTGREQAISSQLYVRTGNYDVGNRHFAFIPQITLASDQTYLPGDVWMMERREWGVLYGFPTRLKSKPLPEHDETYQQLRVLADQVSSFLPSSDNDNGNPSSIESKLAGHLANRAEQLATVLPASEFSTQDKNEIETATRKLMRQTARTLAEIQAAKHKLGALDHELSYCRIGIRKAELRDKTDLQAIGDETVQLASSEGTIRAQSQELLLSLETWRKELSKDATAGQELDTIRKAIELQLQTSIQDLEEPLKDYRNRRDALPSYSKQALETAYTTTQSATLAQYAINQKMARLEQIHQSHTLEMQLPIADPLGDFAIELKALQSESQSVDPKWLDALGIDASSIPNDAAYGYKPIRMSELHTLLPVTLGSNTPIYLYAVSDSNGKMATLYKMATKEVLVSDIVRIAQPNQLTLMGKIGLYLERWIEFLLGEPREAGIEGGFFPAIWGTVVMTLIMSIAVMPFGVIAALYMREYARPGWILSLIRISINNLAGVPSIVYGVFGLAFFCYTIGGYIDGGPAKAGFEAWPSGTWFVAFASTALSGTVAFFLAFLGSGSPAHQSKLRKRIAGMSGIFWLLSLVGLIALLAKSPFFHGFFEATLPNPTYGKGCLLWASCTLALLTLPVVIVATEEALAAVPNSLREGSYACGAGKWQTLQRIVLPYARPGIITGFILAMARGAGEVAPMMLVGAIPLATELPLDLEFPFFHGSRSFMHLGFQIYSLGFQSQNSEAAKPMVFTATLLLLTIVSLLNVTAIWLRARLRKRFQSSQF
jgi:ABC-type phosphate transport system permease subunit